MKHLSFLTLLALAFAGFVSAQSVTVSQDTVYEFGDGDEEGPTRITVLNTTADTLFTDTVIVDLLTSPVPEEIELQIGGGGSIGIHPTEGIQFAQTGAIFVPGEEHTLTSFCLESVIEGVSECACNEPARCWERIEAVIRVRWYFTNGDSMSFYVKGDYIRDYAVSVMHPVRSFPHMRETEGESYLINGKSINSDRIRKTPLPMIRKTKGK